MFVQVYDAESLTKVAIYAGAISAEDYARSVELAWETTRDALRNPGLTARVVVIVETNEQPPATIRRRLAEADKGMPRCDFAFVTHSVLARAAMTAFYWLSPEREGRRRRVFASFGEACEWLVSGGARAGLLDGLHLRARAQLADASPRQSRAP